jgi:hypothetical protein
MSIILSEWCLTQGFFPMHVRAKAGAVAGHTRCGLLSDVSAGLLFSQMAVFFFEFTKKSIGIRGIPFAQFPPDLPLKFYGVKFLFHK